jgi:hypothetical protein
MLSTVRLRPVENRLRNGAGNAHIGTGMFHVKHAAWPSANVGGVTDERFT